MTEALLGVVIGGLIASITPVIQLFYNDNRWKKEIRLNHLKERRASLEAKNDKIITEISNAIFKGTWSADLTSHVEALMPKAASSRLHEYLESEDKSNKAKRIALHEIAFELRKAEAEVDRQIENILVGGAVFTPKSKKIIFGILCLILLFTTFMAGAFVGFSNGYAYRVFQASIGNSYFTTRTLEMINSGDIKGARKNIEMELDSQIVEHWSGLVNMPWKFSMLPQNERRQTNSCQR